MPYPFNSPNFDCAFVITPAPGVIAAPITGQGGRPIPYATAFMTDTNGTVTVVSKEGNNTPVVIHVVAGQLVRLSIRQLLSVSTSMVVTGFL